MQSAKNLRASCRNNEKTFSDNINKLLYVITGTNFERSTRRLEIAQLRSQVYLKDSTETVVRAVCLKDIERVVEARAGAQLETVDKDSVLET